jgi:hypothetical protein
MKKPIVKLNDGTTIPLEVFITWHHVKQWAKTRPIEEQRKIVAERVERTKRAVNTPLGRFNSVAEAAKKYKLDTVQLRKLIRNTAFPEYSYVVPKPRDAKHEFYQLSKPKTLLEEKVVTPLGKFPNKRAAEKAHGISKTRLNTLLRKDSEHYYFIDNGPKANPLPKPRPPKIIKPKKPQAKKPRLSPEAYKEAISKRAKAQLREVITPYGNFESLDKAADFLGVRANFVRRLIHNTAYPEYTYVNPKHISKSKLHYKVKTLFPTLTVTPFGTFASKRKIHKEIGITYEEILYLMEKHPKDFYIIDENEKLQHLNRNS